MALFGDKVSDKSLGDLVTGGEKPESLEEFRKKMLAGTQPQDTRTYAEKSADPTTSLMELETGTATENLPDLPTKEVVNFDELKKPENLKTIRDYAIARYGKAGEQRKGESDEDYIKRWMTAMRQVEWNTTLNGVPELNWIYNAKKEDALKAAAAHQLYEKVPDWYEKGGQGGVRPFAEAAFSAVSDPTNVISFGIGAGVRYQAARQAIKSSISSRLKAFGIAGGADAVIGAADNVVQQNIRIETGRQDKLNTTEVMLSAAISSVFGGVEAASAAKKPAKTTKEDLEAILAGRTKGTTDPATRALTDAFDKDMEETLSQFDIFEGRKILDDLSPQTDLTEAQIRKDINRRAIDVAKYVMIIDPTFRPKQGQKVSDAVKDVFMSFDKIDDVTLEASLNKAGLTLNEFAQATRTTVADAASIMQGYSSLARVLDRIAKLDPEAEKLVQALYGRNQDLPNSLGFIADGIRRVERESKAFVVSSIATTARNIYGTLTGLTFEAASYALEGMLYQSGKVVGSALKGTYQKGDLTRGLKSVVKDTFGTLTYLTNAGITAEVVDKLLVDNPRIREQLFSALQETGNAKLSGAARFANTLNVAQDAFFRRAIFTASVERQLRSVGMDMYDLIASGKNIPSDVLANASDHALKATFSFMPKKGVAHEFVRFFEKMPGGSLVVTFPRFMTNAMAFQFKYSPVGAVSGAADLVAARAIEKSDPAKAMRLYAQANRKLSQGTVGTAAIYAAYKYRLEHQDTEWYQTEAEDGSTLDTRAIFPIAPYLAIGDFLAKQKLGTVEAAKVNEYVAAIVGMKLPAGAQGYMVEQMSEALKNTSGKEAEKFEKALGRLLGDFAGRFVQPGQPVFTYFDLFDKEAQVARDPNVTTTDSVLTETALNRVRAKIPGLKEELPEAKQYLREGPRIRAGEFFSTLTGTRIVPAANDLEKEFTRLGMNPYEFFASTGDKQLDRAIIETSAPYVQSVAKTLKQDRYAGMTENQKRIALANRMKTATTLGRTLARARMEAKDRERLDKLTFNGLSKERRAAINEAYAKDHFGVTMDEAKDYARVYQYDARLEALQ